MNRPHRIHAAGLAACLALGATACQGDGGGETPAPVDVLARRQRHLRDDAGRALVLHGINVMNRSKSSPDRQPDVTPAELDQLAREYGFRFVRHLVFWSAIEPTEGSYDEAYLDAVEDRLDAYEAAGIHVLLDMHQDIFSHAPTWGNGAPAWVVERIHGEIPQIPPVTVWSNAYYLEPVTQAFDAFFADDALGRALRGRYAAMWAKVATRFRDHPAVVGYDLMNEPFPGSAWDAIELGTSQGESTRSYAFDREKLTPFHQEVVDTIRTVDPDTWIFFEPRFGAPGNGSRSYATPITDPRAGDAHVGFAPHFYSVAYEASGRYDPSRDTAIERFEANRGYEMRVLDVPLLVGEFGLDQTGEGALLLTEKQLDAFDRLGAGWAYWSFDPGGPGSVGWNPFFRTGDPTTPLGENPNAELLVRVYPRATAGDLVGFRWDRHSRVFTMTFDPVAGVTGQVPTEIVLNDERFYPDGFDVVLTDDDASLAAVEFDDAANLLRVTTSQLFGRQVLSVTPK